MNTYLKNNLRKGKVKVTVSNPLPCLSDGALSYLARSRKAFACIPADIGVMFKFVGADGYYHHVSYQHLYTPLYRVRVDHVYAHRDSEVDESMLKPLLSNTLIFGKKEENSPDVRMFKQRHKALDFDSLVVNLFQISTHHLLI